MENSKHLYQEGSYRFWLDTNTGSLRLKLDGNKELYTIPKNTKLYDRLMSDLFSKEEVFDPGK
ncbi:hypothetical protein P4361_05890 [Fictibacillus sp. B-59209]|uniref:hypothetical protein n=1 Tax=Fictibacillus sp. B-59209 TaxID=3024873 RepID=UPI002E1AB170|nr:hypothetical protein [Fictibacillus sp. B-59209]